MVQERKTIREQILSALSQGPLSSKELAKKIKCHSETIKNNRAKLISDGLIQEVGQKLGQNGFGMEKIWGLTTPKTKAVNAFDWRNWETQANYSAREIAYSHSQFVKKTEKRVIVYSRA
jgi:predicted ArsR family transcriptional regulator